MSVAGDTVGELSVDAFRNELAGSGLGVRIGPFDVHLRCTVDAIAEPLHRLYRHYPLLDANRVFSAHVSLRETSRPLRLPARRVRLAVDGRAPHEDMPADHALAVLEWGLNLVIALRFHRFLMLHAAVLERHGLALLMPAQPGHGKTTLCAALAHRGWRMLSDEFGLVEPDSVDLVPLPRPMPLKNGSIAAIQAFEPRAELGPRIEGTAKGTVAHLAPPEQSVLRAAERATASLLIFPRWSAGAALELEEMPRAQAFLSLATNAFNFELVGEAAFRTVRQIVDRSRCYRLLYSDLSDAITAIDSLADDERERPGAGSLRETAR